MFCQGWQSQPIKNPSYVKVLTQNLKWQLHVAETNLAEKPTWLAVRTESGMTHRDHCDSVRLIIDRASTIAKVRINGNEYRMLRTSPDQKYTNSPDTLEANTGRNSSRLNHRSNITCLVAVSSETPQIRACGLRPIQRVSKMIHHVQV